MRHIIRGNNTPQEKQAAETALSCHQQKYGDYTRREKSETYRIRIADQTISIEIMNRKASYVATVMNHHRSLSKICGVPV